MIGNDSIDIGLEILWRSWRRFRRGKRRTPEFNWWQYYLENNLFLLHESLAQGAYHHDSYTRFIASETKRRDIAVARIRDRVVHRLLYDYLVDVFDHTFIDDVWSCRVGKGLIGAIERTQKFLRGFPHGFVWRADITKFFDHVRHDVLRTCLRRRISDPRALSLLDEIMRSYACTFFTHERERERERESNRPAVGIPIGNLTSQIFANIYLHEFDRFVVHTLRPNRYLRYGDDFILIAQSYTQLQQMRNASVLFLREKLGLAIPVKNDIMIPVKWGVHFLGVELFPRGRRLNTRNWQRIRDRLAPYNIPSYHGVVTHHSNQKNINYFHWLTLQ